MSAARAGTVAVVDVGLGNFHSLEGALRRLAPAARIELSDKAAKVASSDCVILPGDGAFGSCIAAIDERPGLRAALVEAASAKPFLGICVGMQVLYEASEESAGARGLGVLEGTVRRFAPREGYKVPLMGWLEVGATAPAHPLVAELEPASRFYFLNSYFAPAAGAHVVLTARHASSFAAAVAKDGLFATQFHPEKSSAAGVGLLARFLASAAIELAPS